MFTFHTIWVKRPTIRLCHFIRRRLKDIFSAFYCPPHSYLGVRPSLVYFTAFLELTIQAYRMSSELGSFIKWGRHSIGLIQTRYHLSHYSIAWIAPSIFFTLQSFNSQIFHFLFLFCISVMFQVFTAPIFSF